MNVSKPAMPWLERYCHPCAWDLDFPPLTLPAMFAEAAGKMGKTALVDFLGRKLSYRELYAESRRFAAGLLAQGIAKGDRVGLFLPNVPSYIPAYFGAMLAGATVVNFSPLYSAAELEAQVADSGTRLLVTVDVPALLPTALEVLRASPLETLVVSRLGDQLPALKGLLVRLFGMGQTMAIPTEPGVIHWRDLLRADSSAVFPALDAEHDLALLQYTGGTTGTPKGAMLTHQNLTANARQVDAIDPHNMDYDLILGALPLFHVFANTAVLNRTVITGGTIAMLPRFDAEQVFATLRRLRPTSLPGVPTMFQALLDHPKFDPADFASLRVCIAGGAPLPLALKQRWEAKTGVRLVEGYGLTESSGVVTANSYEGEDRAGTIGQPFPATRVRLLDREDPTRDAPAGEPGELAVIGPQIMKGYWQRPEAAASAFADIDGEQWLRTGDVAVFEADGYLRVVDRIKDMIAVGGFKVFPSQVEHVLLEHPAIKEALVIGLPDELMGERPRAFVTLLEQAAESADELRDWINQRVGKHERVDAVVIRESLPKTMIGKLDRKALREQALG
ncbi:long-chain fatty acid--CoA ligase [Novosphingobium sp. TH158]|uniref:long-chain-fatty-acid--CoA ligase n=1 Tax=Novosphingobium sp. TH158 TaxID=2067455 RepID=UPI000C7E16DB|nr:long-chain fatty acid--CoA ligase [Novosphingobium sp. TH158]PLK27184.1 dicarboxylate--CoA ligase PimA [Novosphingobium sp. TH158]